MNALTSSEVAELHRIAAADSRLDKIDRTVLADAARTGVVDVEALAKRCGGRKPAEVGKRVAKLRAHGYLPAAS